MKFQKVLQFFLPRTPEFYKQFEASAQNVLQGVLVLKKVIVSTPELRDELISELEKIEHRGDEITHNIIHELSKTFITPIDREDIHQIASKLDDILDLVYGAALSIKLYKVTSFAPSVIDLLNVIEEAVGLLTKALPYLGNVGKMEKIQDICVAINSCENIADNIFHSAIAQLFDENHDPVDIIKMKEILSNLEFATDKCEDVADLLENVVIKYA